MTTYEQTYNISSLITEMGQKTAVLVRCLSEDERFPESVRKHMKKLTFLTLDYRNGTKNNSFRLTLSP